MHQKNLDVMTDVFLRKLLIFLQMFGMLSCEVLDNDPEIHVTDKGDSTYIALNEVAHLLSAVPLNNDQLQEVHDAVTSSSGNGYDEEYTMKNLFADPGSGVGDTLQTRSSGSYRNPMREIIGEYLRNHATVRSSGEMTLWEEVGPDRYMEMLEGSDVQIYWPYSESWDGVSQPLITFDPGYDTDFNYGYEVLYNDDGSRTIREVEVDEEVARSRPVWVVNRNSDAGYTSLEMMRRQDPSWGEGGGTIIVKPLGAVTRSDKPLKTLLLKNFVMKRQYDSWFAGASEFFVKIGSIEDFKAETEKDLLEYSPTVTDFMIVVKRDQVGVPQPFNAVLVSDWTEQLTHCAFMIMEDDGGTLTKWDCSAVVKINSKSYGVDISIPVHKRDDIVWRGQLTRRWIEANSDLTGHFGDVDLTFEVLEN